MVVEDQPVLYLSLRVTLFLIEEGQGTKYQYDTAAYKVRVSSSRIAEALVQGHRLRLDCYERIDPKKEAMTSLVMASLGEI